MTRTATLESSCGKSGLGVSDKMTTYFEDFTDTTSETLEGWDIKPPIVMYHNNLTSDWSTPSMEYRQRPAVNIRQGERATIVDLTLWVEGSPFHSVGEAICHPDDREHFNAEVGVALATSRALSKIARQLERQANAYVSQVDNDRRQRQAEDEDLKDLGNLGKPQEVSLNIEWDTEGQEDVGFGYPMFLAPFKEDGYTDRCQAVTGRNKQCSCAAKSGTDYCGHHRHLS